MINKGTARPRLWIVAGPNGSGKSTVYGRNDLVGFDGSVWIINPDLLTVRLQETESLPLLDANLAAVQRIEAWLDASIRVHQTIGVETVLSSSKYRRLVEMARSHDFEVRLIYVFVDSVEEQLNRIRHRVAKGGHDVPADKVRLRRTRSFEQLEWFFYQSDRAWVYDNSGAELELVAQKGDGKVRVKSDAIPELLKALLPPAMLDGDI
ncbi:AAA family ATPase [Sphingobium sp. WCS2017Hpa-17]|uniref:AAA family ATPase n=1 Tax=Sphingobium sp. WCS2017Hpa-17 TaxID=3073638 RepID=UPI00288ADC3B|nr:AAA family ATPase [Sphingobium sp. WCS2017Hpa-17]